MKQGILFIDADPVRYRVGFAGETISYEIIVEHASGDIERKLFSPAGGKSAHDLAKEYFAANPTVGELERIKHVDVQPESHVMQMLDAQMGSIEKEVRDHLGLRRSQLKVTYVLSGSTNYRDKLATLKEYKGNRDPEHKPTHYAAIGERLKSYYGAVVSEGREADDEVSIRARRTRNAVIATIDKDLDQIPGLHYDYKKKVFYEVSPQDARRWFWQQVLSGDSTDNIGGACGIGLERAETLLRDWEQDYFERDDDGDSTEFDAFIWGCVVEVYNERRDRAKCYYRGSRLETEQIALENARLVYLQQEPDELWTPPGRLKEYLSGNRSIDD